MFTVNDNGFIIDLSLNLKTTLSWTTDSLWSSKSFVFLFFFVVKFSKRLPFQNISGGAFAHQLTL